MNPDLLKIENIFQCFLQNSKIPNSLGVSTFYKCRSDHLELFLGNRTISSGFFIECVLAIQIGHRKFGLDKFWAFQVPMKLAFLWKDNNL